MRKLGCVFSVTEHGSPCTAAGEGGMIPITITVVPRHLRWTHVHVRWRTPVHKLSLCLDRRCGRWEGCSGAGGCRLAASRPAGAHLWARFLIWDWSAFDFHSYACWWSLLFALFPIKWFIFPNGWTGYSPLALAPRVNLELFWCLQLWKQYISLK